MNGVYGNPDEMRHFAYHLTKFAMDLRTLDSQTRAKMNQLFQSWKDSKSQEFEEKYNNSAKFIKPFTEILDGYSASLKQSASILDDFLKRPI